MHPGQIEIIKENIIMPLFESLVEEYSNLPKRAPLYFNGTDSYSIDKPSLELAINSMFYKRSEHHNNVEDYLEKYASDEFKMVSRHFSQMNSGEFNLKSTFGENAPSVDEFRLAFYGILIDLLNEYSIERKENSPIFKEIEAHESGMDKIRLLVQNLLSALANIQRYRLEVSKFMLEIILEKRKLNLPCLYDSGMSLHTFTIKTPLIDLSYLDLSGLQLEIPFDHSVCGCEVDMSHSNLDFSDLKTSSDNYIFVNVTPSSLRGCDFKNFKPIDLNLKDADISGAYFGDDWIPDRRAKNFLSFSRTAEDLVKFRNESRGLGNIPSLDDNQAESNHRGGPTYRCQIS